MTLLILHRIASGDVSAVRDCIDQYGGLIGRMARRLSKTPSDAEDATQEIFLQIWRQASRFDAARGSEITFIAMIARRRLIDRLRKTATDPLMGSSDDALEFVEWAAPGNTAETWEEAEHAMRALKDLRAEHRRVLELGCLRGWSHSEIARQLDLPLGTVKSSMRRGLMRIRRCITGGMPNATATRKISQSIADVFPTAPNCLDEPTVAAGLGPSCALGTHRIADA